MTGWQIAHFIGAAMIGSGCAMFLFLFVITWRRR